MKAPAFGCVVARTVNEALEALSQDEDATVIAGGQSLVPLLALRLAYPTTLVDLNHVEELRGLSRMPDGGIRIGAMTRQSELAAWLPLSELNPLVAAAIPYIAHESIRNRGTVGGSIAHADPAAEWPLLAVALDATIEVVGPEGAHDVSARAFFVGPFTTALPAGHVVRAVRLPPFDPSIGWDLYEVTRRHGDFALAGAIALVSVDGDVIAGARITLMGAGGPPIVLTDVGSALEGCDLASIGDAILDAMPSKEAFSGDLQAPPEFRHHLANVVVRRAVTRAVARWQPGDAA